MANLNRCEFIGNLGAAPDVRYTTSGVAVANFSITVTEKWKGQDGKQNEQTEWVRCVAWNRLAEICGDFLRKGSSVWISGKMQTRSYEKDGEKKYITEIVVREMQMLGGKGSSRGPEGANPGDITSDCEDVPF